MGLRSLQHRLRQSFYRPAKSRFFSTKAIKDWEEIDKAIEKNLGELIGKKKDKEEDEKPDKK